MRVQDRHLITFSTAAIYTTRLASPEPPHIAESSRPVPLAFTTMSFFGMGGGRPQPSSAERIAAAEAEIELVSDMFNRYVSPMHMPWLHISP